jgi:predicted enzyme related to lactoylglutathione lyase
MSSGIKTIIYPVKDLDRAKAVYGQLAGSAPYADQPYYVGYKVDGQDIGLDPNGHAQGMTGPLAYWHVDDIQASLQQLRDAGVEEVSGVRDVGGGRQIATVKDADGNQIGLLQDA